MDTDPKPRSETEASSWQERYEESLARERDANHPANWPKEVWPGLALTAIGRVVVAGFILWVAAASGNAAVWVVAIVYALYVLLIVVGRTRAWLRRNDAPRDAGGESQPSDR